MPNLTTIAEWAKTEGISRQSAYDAVKRCEIPVTDGKVDPDYASHLYRKNTRQRANGNRPELSATGAEPAGTVGQGGVEPPPKPKVPGYDSSRARREAAEAEKAELQLAELAGKFLLKSDVDSAVFEAARAVRDGLTNCARRIAADIATTNSADECEAIIEREHRLLLESMAHTFGEKLGTQLEAWGE